MGLAKLWAEFKAFAFQGNMIELAVAVVIGGAFGTVIQSLVGDLIMPTVGYAIHQGEAAAVKAKEGIESGAAKMGIAAPATAPTTAPTTAATTAPPTTTDKAAADKAAADKAVADQAAADKAAADAAKQPVKIDLMLGPIPIGKFITALLNFIIVAAAVFVMIVKLLGGVMKKVQGPEVPGEPTTRECPECLSIIPIKAKRCSHCTAVIEPPVVA